MSLRELFAAAQPTAVGVVTNSVEFSRVAALPRRVLDLDDVIDVTPLFAKTGSLAFWPIQSAALIEAAKADGLFAMIGVGHGKTLIGLALPEAMDSQRAVYLVKPDLKRQLEREAESFYGKHFDLPLDRISVVAYSELSSAKQADILEQLNPDLIIADEAHHLRHRDAARTKRFLRYMVETPTCRFAALSGTMTNRSVTEYAHLLELALRKNSPLPRGYREIRDWGGALDVKPQYHMRPGVLKRLCGPREDVRAGFRRRLVETQGVVATAESAVGTSLIIRKRTMRVPDAIEDLIAELTKTWCLNGEEYTTAIDKARALKQLACGFYYRWDWPDDAPDYEWFEARAAWNREVREKLKHASAGLDSPLLLERAAKRYWAWVDAGCPRGQKPEKGWASEAWPAWRCVKDRKPPPTVAVWESDFVVDASIAWARKQKEPAIVWYEWKALGERIASKGQLPHYGAGTDASESKERVIVASVRTQGTGKNLQHYSTNLLTSVPPNGTTFEQTAGRTHRPGQLADEVTIEWFGHTASLEDAMAQVIEDAEYMQETTGQRQKVLYATRIGE